MKRAIPLALAVTAVALGPAAAWAGNAATNAALGLGAFAVFNQIISGTGIFGAVVAPAPVYAAPVYAPPPPVYASPPPAYVVPAPVYVAPPVYVVPRAVYFAPPPPVVYVKKARVVYPAAPRYVAPRAYAPHGHGYHGGHH